MVKRIDIDTTAKSMWNELEASGEQVDDRLCNWDDFIQRYEGAYAGKTGRKGEAPPFNPMLETLAITTAQIIAGDPVTIWKPMRSDDPSIEIRCAGLEFSVNEVSRSMGLKQQLRKVFVDRSMYDAFLWLERKRYSSLDRGPLNAPVARPFFRRVSPRMVRSDPRAQEWDETRWRAVGFVTNPQSVLNAIGEGDKGWLRGVIEKLEPDIVDKRDQLIPKFGERVDRNDFIMWVVWFPEEELSERFTAKEGFYGTLHFYAQTQLKSTPGQPAPMVVIRQPQPFFGSRYGPLHRFGQHYVPDRKETISTMLAVESQTRSRAKVKAAIARAMAMYKHFAINGTGKKQIGDILRKAAHDGIVDVPNFTKEKFADYVTGGIDAQMITQEQYSDESYGRAIGNSSTTAGQPKAGTTATAETIAAGALDARMELDRDMFYDDLKCAMQSLGEMIDSDNQFYIKLPPEVQAQTGIAMTALRGGRGEGQSFDDYAMDLCPLSMRAKTEIDMKQAALDEVALFQQIGPSIIQEPFYDWPAIIRDYARATGNHTLPARFNEVLAGQLASLAYQGAIDASQMFQRGSGAMTPFLVTKKEDRVEYEAPEPNAGAGATQQAAGPGAGSLGAQRSQGPLTKGRTTVGQRAGAKAGGLARMGKVGATK